jgi:PIN domain nuclease of toxin-antitoxin system
LKYSLGKLRMPVDFEARLALEQFGELPLRAAHTRESALLAWHHRDPFDRMLIAQARVEGLRLLTADGTLVRYGEVVFITS